MTSRICALVLSVVTIGAAVVYAAHLRLANLY